MPDRAHSKKGKRVIDPDSQSNESEETDRPFAKSEVMQNLLEMMQKIAAEPDNTAQWAKDSQGDAKAVLAETAETARSVEIAVIGDDLNQDEVLPVVLEKSVATKKHDDALANADDIVDLPNSDIVVAESAPLSPAVEGGPVKRWIKRAVAWFKRLIGY